MTLRFKNYRVKTNQLVCSKIFKSTTGMSPELMNDIFHYVERSTAQIVFLSPLPNYKKNSASLKEFKTKINDWRADHCPCRICKKCLFPQTLYVHSFAIFLFNHLHLHLFARPYFLVVHYLVVFFSRTQSSCILFNYLETFGFIYSHVDISADCRDWRNFMETFFLFLNWLSHISQTNELCVLQLNNEHKKVNGSIKKNIYGWNIRWWHIMTNEVIM